MTRDVLDAFCDEPRPAVTLAESVKALRRAVAYCDANRSVGIMVDPRHLRTVLDAIASADERAASLAAERDAAVARAERLATAQDVSRDVVWYAMLHHGLPWRVEQDWTHEVTAADGTVIAKCMTHTRAAAIIALAESIDADHRKPACVYCGAPPACRSASEGDAPVLACDDCCGHGGEDGHCEPVDALSDAARADGGGR